MNIIKASEVIVNKRNEYKEGEFVIIKSSLKKQNGNYLIAPDSICKVTKVRDKENRSEEHKFKCRNATTCILSSRTQCIKVEPASLESSDKSIWTCFCEIQKLTDVKSIDMSHMTPIYYGLSCNEYEEVFIYTSYTDDGVLTDSYEDEDYERLMDLKQYGINEIMESTFEVPDDTMLEQVEALMNHLGFIRCDNLDEDDTDEDEIPY